MKSRTLWFAASVTAAVAPFLVAQTPTAQGLPPVCADQFVIAQSPAMAYACAAWAQQGPAGGPPEQVAGIGDWFNQNNQWMRDHPDADPNGHHDEGRQLNPTDPNSTVPVQVPNNEPPAKPDYCGPGDTDFGCGQG